ncbi:MAG: multicopper oxidase domain-containing protein [Nitriliruptoraceae bacterium]
MSRELDPEQIERTGEQPPEPDDNSSVRRMSNWFGAVFGIIVLVGVGVIYVANRSAAGADSGEPETEEVTDSSETAAEPVGEGPVSGVSDTTHTADTTAVLLGMYIVDSFGFHGLEEVYAEADEVGEGDAGQVAKVLTAVDTVAWPDELAGVAAAFRTDVDGLHTALEAGDIDGARHALEAVHGSQHDLSNGVYDWLAGTPVQAHAGEPPGEEAEVIDVEMVDFGYVPSRIELEAGVPAILRFTNTGRLVHEAMVGDAHMQEEFAAAGDHGDGQNGTGHDDSDDHHGELMAVTVQPGETADLEVVIDEAGEWFVACHLVGHLEQGQIATIDVSA